MVKPLAQAGDAPGALRIPASPVRSNTAVCIERNTTILPGTKTCDSLPGSTTPHTAGRLDHCAEGQPAQQGADRPVH